MSWSRKWLSAITSTYLVIERGQFLLQFIYLYAVNNKTIDPETLLYKLHQTCLTIVVVAN